MNLRELTIRINLAPAVNKAWRKFSTWRRARKAIGGLRRRMLDYSTIVPGSQEGLIFLKTLDAPQHTVRACLITENPFQRWYGREVTVVGHTAIDWERGKNFVPRPTLPLLDGITGEGLGVVDCIRTHKGEMTGRLRFVTDDAKEKTFPKIVERRPFHVELSYEVYKMREIMGGEYQVTRWCPLSVSLVPGPPHQEIPPGEFIELRKSRKTDRVTQ